jgi:hypothetical protein
MLLFADLPTPPAAPATPRALPRIVTWWEAVRATLAQHRIRAPLRDLIRDDLADRDDYPRRRSIKADDAPPIRPAAPASVFAAASVLRALAVARTALPPSERPLYRVHRADGRTRCERIRPEDTPEWQEKERIRRAKQRPPKPVAKAKTRGKTVRKWDGEVTE